MPDQHTAATEHDLISTIAEPLGQLPEDPLAVVSVEFPVALRGYDRIAVDAYVERTAQLVAELQSTRSPEAAVRRALQRLGEEISGILQRAHDTADEITARSRSEAEERLETARREARELTADAERRVADLDAETERIWAERHGIVTDAHELARRLTGLAEEALERFPAAAPPDAATIPAPLHPFDVEVPDSPEPAVDDEPTVKQLTADDPAPEPPIAAFPAVEQPAAELSALAPATADDPASAQPAADHSPIEQATVDMPPIEPWEGEDPGPFDTGEA